MGSAQGCVYCAKNPATSAAPRRPASAASGPTCGNCGQRAPALAAGTTSFRCFQCGAATDLALAGAQRNVDTRLSEGARQGRAAPSRQLTIAQIRAMRGERESLAFPLLVTGLFGLCLLVAYLFAGLRELNPTRPVLALACLPAALLVLAVLESMFRTWRARRALEQLCAAIPPKGGGGQPRCYSCGKHLTGRGYVERCGGCGTDNVTAEGAMRREGRNDQSLQLEADRPVLDEVVFRHDKLEREHGITRRSVVLSPLAALFLLGASFWQQQWRLPALSTRHHVVIATPGCNMVVTPIGRPSNGFTKTNVTQRGSWVVRDRFSLVYDRDFEPEEFVGKKVVLRDSGEVAKVRAVFRRPASSRLHLLVDGAGKQHELPLIRACIDESNPYRDVAGLTREQRLNTRAERERRKLQGQLHEPTAQKGEAAAEPAREAQPAVDPSLQMWTRPQK